MKSPVGDVFTTRAAYFLGESFLPKISNCLDQLDEEQIWWRPNESSNSIGNLILHLCGNLRQWVMTGLAGIPDDRDRRQEFARRDPVAGPILFEELSETVSEANRVITGLSREELMKPRRIQIYDVTGLEAVFHVVEHFSYHTGQILYITKLLAGADLKLTDDKRVN